MLEVFIQIVDVMRSHPWAPVCFVAVLGLACMVVPITLLVVAGGVLFGFWGGILMNLMGILLGSSASFWMARRFAHDRVDRWLHHREGLSSFFRRTWDFRFMLIVRLVGLPPFTLTNYLAGLTRLSFRDYLWATTLGAVPWLVLIGFLSDALWNVLRAAGLNGFREALAQESRSLMIGMVLLAGMVGVSYLFKRRAVRGGEPEES